MGQRISFRWDHVVSLVIFYVQVFSMNGELLDEELYFLCMRCTMHVAASVPDGLHTKGPTFTSSRAVV